ncbi:MAG: hypothetical protein L3K06_05980 [Thermoplasmata archaeon]|nr:hypothetical protein [Thermoplasmata archaeon]
MVPAEPGAWRTCRVCGGAVPFNERICPTCGQSSSVATDQIAQLPRGPRRRVRAAQYLRAAIVVGVAVGLSYALLSAVWSGPPTFSDPLTTRGTYVLGPGNFTYLAGWITGEDYIDGNYTVTNPVGTSLVFQVYNASGFSDWFHHRPATPQWNQTGADSGAIVFAAPYTDTFYLVFENPYIPTSGITMTVYIATNYQSNVVIG